eukprot:3027666-Amphidinium_carterae.2
MSQCERMKLLVHAPALWALRRRPRPGALCPWTCGAGHLIMNAGQCSSDDLLGLLFSHADR